MTGSYSSQYFSGNICEAHFIDGQSLTPASFAEANEDTGQWLPIKYSGTYESPTGTNPNDGTTWSETNDLLTTRYYPGGAGTQTAALCISGQRPPGGTNITNSETWNGTSWTEVADLKDRTRLHLILL